VATEAAAIQAGSMMNELSPVTSEFIVKNRIKNIVRDKIYDHRCLYSLFTYMRYLKSSKLFFYRINYPIRDIVVCGTPRSGSTLLFNLVREMVRVKLDRIDGFFATENQYKNLLLNENSFFVKKNHEISWLLMRRIKMKLSIGFFTHRDIRDVVVSLMQKGWVQDFDDWIDRKGLHKIVNDALIYAGVKNMNFISYEELINDRIKIIENIQKILNIDSIEESLMNVIEKNSSIEETKKRIENTLINDDHNRYTHLHRNHIADARVGKWKYYLSDEKIEIINSISKDYLIKFNYTV
jgi:hypothetical protein